MRCQVEKIDRSLSEYRPATMWQLRRQRSLSTVEQDMEDSDVDGRLIEQSSMMPPFWSRLLTDCELTTPTGSACDGVWTRHAGKMNPFRRAVSADVHVAPSLVLQICRSAHSCALIDRETRDGLSRKGRVLNDPGRPTVARLQDSRTTAGVADQGRRAGNGREAGDTRGRSCVGPRRTVVVRHDDGCNMPTVVAHGDTRGRERGAGDCADVRQWRVARRGVPRRRCSGGGRRRELACDHSGQGKAHHRCKRGNGDTSDRTHAHLPP